MSALFCVKSWVLRPLFLSILFPTDKFWWRLAVEMSSLVSVNQLDQRIYCFERQVDDGLVWVHKRVRLVVSGT